MNTSLATTTDQPQALAAKEIPTFSDAINKMVLANGDLEKLSEGQRVEFLVGVCEAVGVDPRTQPFAFLKLQGKTVLYARKDCTEQLRARHKITAELVGERIVNEVLLIKARVTQGSRSDEATGAVNVKGLSGEALANAYMKAETKAKRRATLSFCGLGMLDESEVEILGGKGEGGFVPNVSREERAAVLKEFWAMGAEVFGKEEAGKEAFKRWIEARDLTVAAIKEMLPDGIRLLMQQLEAESQGEETKTTWSDTFDANAVEVGTVDSND